MRYTKKEIVEVLAQLYGLVKGSKGILCPPTSPMYNESVGKKVEEILKEQSK